MQGHNDMLTLCTVLFFKTVLKNKSLLINKEGIEVRDWSQSPSLNGLAQASFHEFYSCKEMDSAIATVISAKDLRPQMRPLPQLQL